MATSESTRARRFALPDLRDERTSESIEAFLEGPDVRRGPRPRRPPDAAIAVDPSSNSEVVASQVEAVPDSEPLDRRAVFLAPPSNASLRSTADLRTLPGRLDWNAALERESVRAARYGRPAAVAIVELKPERSGQTIEPWLRTLAGPIARVLRADSRATDLVARVASTRFQILLPETTEAGAERLAKRVAAGCRTFIASTGAPVSVRICVAGTAHDSSLHEAVTDALRSIEAA